MANDTSVERQKAMADKEAAGEPRKRSYDDWVARILEIRASDEHHVYARVYWMYWPDELPANTRDGKKLVKGRQPYHGTSELIASNHSKFYPPCMLRIGRFSADELNSGHYQRGQRNLLSHCKSMVGRK